MEQVKTAAIVLAAGHGKRMHSKVAKQYLLLKGEPVVVHALRAFEKQGWMRLFWWPEQTKWNSVTGISWSSMDLPE